MTGYFGYAFEPNHGSGGGGGAGWPGRGVVQNQGGFGGIGGDGLYIPQFSTLGDSGWFAGGGGGIIYDNGQQANYGGRGGGGRGGWTRATAFDGSAGTANTGGGGGGGRYSVSGFAGGSGVVVVDYSPRLTANLPTDGFYHTTGTASDAKGITVTAYNLTGNVTVYAPTGYEVSATSGGSYASTLTLTPSSGVVSTTIYLRIAAATIFANPTGTVTLSTSGLANTSVDLNVFRLVFTNLGDNSFTMPSHVSKVDLLVVGGGGGGGTDMGGGGGGGGVIYTKAYTVSPGTQYKAVVGAGGRGGPAGASPVQVGENGGNSQFGNGSAVLTAIGGGAGASGHRGDNGGPAVSARTGGSGGGASGAGANRNGGAAAAGTTGQGFAGGNSAGDWYSGGGGGAGGAGSSNAGNGGPGLLVPILGRDLYWGGGGGSGGYSGNGGKKGKSSLNKAPSWCRLLKIKKSGKPPGWRACPLHQFGQKARITRSYLTSFQ
jgi:hypothetical protein